MKNTVWMVLLAFILSGCLDQSTSSDDDNNTSESVSSQTEKAEDNASNDSPAEQKGTDPAPVQQGDFSALAGVYASNFAAIEKYLVINSDGSIVEYEYDGFNLNDSDTFQDSFCSTPEKVELFEDICSEIEEEIDQNCYWKDDQIRLEQRADNRYEFLYTDENGNAFADEDGETIHLIKTDTGLNMQVTNAAGLSEWPYTTSSLLVSDFAPLCEE